MDTERQKVIFMPFQIILCLSPNVHINVALNGIIIITFSIHSVVSFFFPFTVSQMLQPPITLDNGFIHRSLFRRVLNKMSEVTKHKRNNLRILHLSNYSLAIACAFALYVIYKAIITQSNCDTSATDSITAT